MGYSCSENLSKVSKGLTGILLSMARPLAISVKLFVQQMFRKGRNYSKGKVDKGGALFSKRRLKQHCQNTMLSLERKNFDFTQKESKSLSYLIRTRAPGLGKPNRRRSNRIRIAKTIPSVPCYRTCYLYLLHSTVRYGIGLPSKRVISSYFSHKSIFFSKILLGNPKFFPVGN